MLPSTEPIQDDPVIRGLVKSKVNRLIGRIGFPFEDREDLEQELLLKVYQRWRNFDRRRGSAYAFAKTLVERAAMNLMRDRFAAKRDPRRVQSLHTKVRGSDGACELIDTIGLAEVNNRRMRWPLSDAAAAILGLDVDSIVQDLPTEDRDLAERLKSKSLSQVARELAMPRATLNDQVRRLRRPFEDAGLKAYLQGAVISSGDRVVS